MKILFTILTLIIGTSFAAIAEMPEAYAKLDKVDLISSHGNSFTFTGSGNVRLLLLSEDATSKWKRNGEPAGFVSLVAKNCIFKITKDHLHRSIRDPDYKQSVENWKKIKAALEKSGALSISIHSVEVTIKNGIVTEIIGRAGIQLASPLFIDQAKENKSQQSNR